MTIVGLPSHLSESYWLKSFVYYFGKPIGCIFDQSISAPVNRRYRSATVLFVSKVLFRLGKIGFLDANFFAPKSVINKFRKASVKGYE